MVLMHQKIPHDKKKPYWSLRKFETFNDHNETVERPYSNFLLIFFLIVKNFLNCHLLDTDSLFFKCFLFSKWSNSTHLLSEFLLIYNIYDNIYYIYIVLYCTYFFNNIFIYFNCSLLFFNFMFLLF